MIWLKERNESWRGATTVNGAKSLKNATLSSSVSSFCACSKDDRLGEHGVERLGILNSTIINASGKFVLDVGRRDQLIFSENIVIVIASGGYREDDVRRDGILFYTNVENKGEKGFNLTVPRLGKWCIGVGVGG